MSLAFSNKKMVTPLQLLKVVNSLAYRRRLENTIPDLEGIVQQYMRENETDKVSIGSYQVSRENGQITIYELPTVDVDQLKLPLCATRDEEKDETEKRNQG